MLTIWRHRVQWYENDTCTRLEPGPRSQRLKECKHKKWYGNNMKWQENVKVPKCAVVICISYYVHCLRARPALGSGPGLGPALAEALGPDAVSQNHHPKKCMQAQWNKCEKTLIFDSRMILMFVPWWWNSTVKITPMSGPGFKIEIFVTGRSSGPQNFVFCVTRSQNTCLVPCISLRIWAIWVSIHCRIFLCIVDVFMSSMHGCNASPTSAKRTTLKFGSTRLAYFADIRYF